MKETRYQASDLSRFAGELFRLAGLSERMANTVADILVSGDLMGHSTHGLKLMEPYLNALKDGTMTKDGKLEIVSDRQTTITWDAHYLPGPWVVQNALETGYDRLRQHPVVTQVIRKSHHIACLGSYLQEPTRRGFLVLLATSDPSVGTVAPYGGVTPVYSPNPIGVGIPTDEDPILIDMSTSCTANGLVQRLKEQKKTLPHKWLLDSKGQPSDDPTDFFADPPGTILPLGGLDLGYKGFALGLIVEALTSALGGFGRSDGAKRWGASVFIQLIDPDRFSSTGYFKRETSWLVQACLSSTPGPASEGRILMPGTLELEAQREQLSSGLRLEEQIVESLRSCAEEFGVEMPAEMVVEPPTNGVSNDTSSG